MKKSRIDTADTRKRIVAAASITFPARGLAATGIADIMAAAGLTKGGFYRHFESKEQLIAEANNAASEQAIETYEAAAAGKPPREALETIVRLYLHQFQGSETAPPCPVAQLGSELRHSDGQIRNAAMDGYQRLLRLITLLTRQLEIAEPLGVADAIVSTMVGAVTLSRLASDSAMAETILEHTQTAVGILLQASPDKHPEDATL